MLRDFFIFKNFKYIESDYFLFVNKFIRFIINIYINDIQIYKSKRFIYIKEFKKKLIS